MDKKEITIKKRQDKHRETVLRHLKTTPIVEVACKRTGIGRATYYRWRHKSVKFANKADAAIEEGLNLTNDMAESQLISAIKEKNLGAIIFWLKSHKIQYGNKLEIKGQLKTESDKLTTEQEEAITKALKLASLVDLNNKSSKGEEKYEQQETKS